MSDSEVARLLPPFTNADREAVLENLRNPAEGMRHGQPLGPIAVNIAERYEATVVELERRLGQPGGYEAEIERLRQRLNEAAPYLEGVDHYVNIGTSADGRYRWDRVRGYRRIPYDPPAPTPPTLWERIRQWLTK